MTITMPTHPIPSGNVPATVRPVGPAPFTWPRAETVPFYVVRSTDGADVGTFPTWAGAAASQAAAERATGQPHHVTTGDRPAPTWAT